MDIDKLIAIVTIILTLSIASERLVEIIKGFRPQWFTQPPLETEGVIAIDEEPAVTEAIEIKRRDAEARRKANVSILAIACGMITAFLASPILASIFKDIFSTSSGCKPFSNFFDGLGEILPCGFNISINGVLLTLALGLLASGGAAMWNSILEYLLRVKDLKVIETRRKEALRIIEIKRANVAFEAYKARLSNLEKK